MTADVRIDKWLWYARFCKTRTMATRLVAAGKVRVNKVPQSKAHYLVKVGDVLTFPQGDHIRVIEVTALGERRGPAAEAQGLYRDLSPPDRERRSKEPSLDAPPVVAQRAEGAGRPTKAERRALDRLRGRR